MMFRPVFFLMVFFLLGPPEAWAHTRKPPTAQDIANLTSMIENDPNSSRLYQERGHDYAVLGEKEKAIADYRAAAAHNPPHPHLLFWSYGWALFELGDYSSAIVMWQDVIAMEQKKGDIGVKWALYTLAVGYWGAGNRELAFHYLSEEAKQDARWSTRFGVLLSTRNWSEKEQTIALQLFDAWQAEVNKTGSFPK